MEKLTRPFDPASYLEDEVSIAAYLADALESGDEAFIADALGVVSRAKGMTSVAKKAGLSREHLYRALSKSGNPELSTLLKVFGALGLRLTAIPAKV